MARYLPGLAGTQITRAVADDRIGVGAWGGLTVLLAWNGAAPTGGLLMLRRRDA